MCPMSGRKQSRPVCVRVEAGREVDVAGDNCALLQKPETKTKMCNIHCTLSWTEKNRGPCSGKCAPGNQNVTYQVNICFKPNIDYTFFAVCEEAGESEGCGGGGEVLST